MSKRLPLLALLCTLAACIRQSPVIYLDHEWSSYYAKNNCVLYLPLGDRDPGFEACLMRQVQALQSFERMLLAQLRTHPDCTGVVVANVADVAAPPPATRFWRLLINLDDLEGKREPWDLMGPKSPEMHHGAGGASDIAGDVCSIAAGHATRRK